MTEIPQRELKFLSAIASDKSELLKLNFLVIYDAQWSEKCTPLYTNSIAQVANAAWLN